METEKHSAFLSGTIQTYIPEKRYGFIRCGSLTYFFHQTAMETPFEPEIGKKVTFVPSENRKGRCAVRVRPVYPKVKGEFGYIPLPNKRCALDNRECIAFLRAQHEAITQTLDLLTQCGITATMSPNGWVTLDTHAFDTLRDAGADGGNRARRVPSGYPDTFANLLRLLERQLNHFNRVYSNLQKGMAGERNTAYALRSVEMRYPVLYNVLLEEGKGKRRFSAESDAVVLTNRAMFLVETKNYGGKGDVLRIAADGRWTVYNPTKRKTIVVSPNPDFRPCVRDAAVFAARRGDGAADCPGDRHREQQCQRGGRKRRRSAARAAVRYAGDVHPQPDRILPGRCAGR